MLRNPWLIVAFLLALEVFILYLANHARFKKYFDFLPSVFWIYFLPMLASTAGFIDAKSPIYQLISTNLLPASLFLLLITVDIKAILKLGRVALIMFFAGSAGIVFGAPLVFFLFKDIIGPDFWMGFGAIAASWTGGSANMIAVKEAMTTPDAVFLPMVIVDTIVPYVWMGIMVALVSFQPLYDKWNKSDRTILNELADKTKDASADKIQKLNFKNVILILLIAGVGSLAAQKISHFLPVIKDIISPTAWTIIVVSTLGLILSLTKARSVAQLGSTRVGYFILYFVLTTIGAKANISNIGSSLILILSGFCLVLFHAFILIITARLIKAPMFLVAVASQANIGGVASAPIVAEIYQPGLASVGLLLAILGNIVGTYFGILAAQLCRLFI